MQERRYRLLLLVAHVVGESGVHDARGGWLEDGVLGHLPVDILVVHLELGQLPTVVNGDDQFVDEEEDETAQDDATNDAEDDVENARRLGALALADDLQVDLEIK